MSMHFNEFIIATKEPLTKGLLKFKIKILYLFMKN